MPRRPDKDIEQITDQIETRVENEMRDNVLALSANELGREFSISENTAAKILRGLGFEFDGYFWYKAVKK